MFIGARKLGLTKMLYKGIISIKYITIVILIFVVLLIIGCNANENGFDKSTSVSSKNILDECRCRSQCYGEKIYDYCLIKESKSPQDCKSFMGTYLGKSYDGSVKYYFNEDHLDRCYKAVISKQITTDLCPNFPNDYSYMCFNSVGTKLLDPNICKNIPYTFKADCYLHISKNNFKFNLELCNELNSEDRVKCYANRATINNNSSICLGLGNSIDKNNCYSQIEENFDPKFERQHYIPIYYDWFIKAKFDKKIIDQSYCTFENNNIIVDDSRRNDTCYISLAMYRGNFNECYKLPADYRGINLIRRCLFYTALWNHFELKDCDSLGIDFKECQEGVILSKRNPDLCYEFYEDWEDQGWCVLKMATDYYGAYGNENILLCDKNGGYMKNKCLEEGHYQKYEKSDNPRVCKLLLETFPQYGNRCYYNLAIKNLDISLCEEIEDGTPLESDCRERVQHANKNP